MTPEQLTQQTGAQSVQLQDLERNITELQDLFNQQNKSIEEADRAYKDLMVKQDHQRHETEQVKKDVATPRGDSGNKNFHEDKVLNHFTPEKFDRNRGKFLSWAKGIRMLLDGHGFDYVEECLLWAAAEKTVITTETFDLYAVDKDWKNPMTQEHATMNKTLCRYLELYTEGEAGSIVESITEGKEVENRKNGMEAWRLVWKRFAPKTAAQAMSIQRAAMKISEAKDYDEIWKTYCRARASGRAVPGA